MSGIHACARALAVVLLLGSASSWAKPEGKAEPNTQVPAGNRHYAATGFPDRIVASPAQDASRGFAVAWRTDTSVSTPLLEWVVAGDSPDVGTPRRVTAVTDPEVWIGNAAQALHPVAGQGLNLGLRDAFELARDLADNEYAQRPAAVSQVLDRFAGRRRMDRGITTGVTDLLASAFTWPLARPLQSALLTTMDLLPPVRKPLARTLLFGRR